MKLKKEFWDGLPKYVRARIEKAKKQVVEGKITPHDEVVNKYAKYLLYSSFKN